MDTVKEKELSPHEAQMENVRRMYDVARSIKEIPELPSEQPKDVSPLLRVEFPEHGGILTYMGGHDEPYKGFPLFDMVEKIDIIKKFTRGTLSSLFHSLKRRNKIQLLIVALSPWLLFDLVKAAIYTFYRTIERFRIKTIRYSDAVREIHRAFSIELHGERDSDRELRFQIRDLVCMFLELDNAYRFRAQDILVELDTAALTARPSAELRRLLMLMRSREKNQDVADTWTLALRFMPFFLILKPTFKTRLVRILHALDLEKVALSKEDKHFCRPRTDYQFGFTANEYVSNKFLP